MSNAAEARRLVDNMGLTGTVKAEAENAPPLPDAAVDLVRRTLLLSTSTSGETVR